MKSNKLDIYAELFATEGFFELEDVQSLTDDDLKELGIKKMGYRKKILRTVSMAIPKSRTPSASYSIVPVTDTFRRNELADQLERFVQSAHKKILVVENIEEIINKTLEKQFETRKSKQFDARTVMKFHGTSLASLYHIISEGFKIPASAGMFGKGIYFATDSSKSAQYTGSSHKLLFCEVLVGKQLELHKAQPDLDFQKITQLGYDSVYAPRDTKEKGGVRFDEFVVYHQHQALPRYLFTCHTDHV